MPATESESEGLATSGDGIGSKQAVSKLFSHFLLFRHDFGRRLSNSSLGGIAMSFKQPVQDVRQVLLFATSVDESIPSDADVRVVSEVMDSLDWSALESSYSDIGCPAYPPRMLAKVLVYAYSKGIRSSRKIEDLLENDKRYMWLAEGLKPDHNTIARFRKTKYAQFECLFSDSVRLCAEAGLVDLNVVSVDSTKIASCASKRSLYDQARVSAAVERILAEADDVDAAEDALYGDGNGRELPDDLKDPAKRKAKLEALAKRLEDEKLKNTSSSEPDSRVMKVSGKLRPGYSMQAAVDASNQVIVGMQVSQCASDCGKLRSMLEQVTANTGLSCDVALADSGYSDEETFAWLEQSGQEAILAPKEHPKNKRNDLFSSRCFLGSDEADELICPAGRRLVFTREFRAGSGRYKTYAATGCGSCSFHKQCVSSGRGSRRVSVSCVRELRERMRKRLTDADGRRLFALRKQTVEPVFGQMKANMRFDRFRAWGKSGASAESALICIAHNVLKCARSRVADVSACFARTSAALVESIRTAVGHMTLIAKKSVAIQASF